MPAARAEDLQTAGKAMLEARLQGSPLRQESPIKFDLQPTEEFEMIHERHSADRAARAPTADHRATGGRESRAEEHDCDTRRHTAILVGTNTNKHTGAL
jgi:hypothetical protein